MSFGKVTPEQREEVEKFGLVIYSWDEFLQLVGLYIWYLCLLNGYEFWYKKKKNPPTARVNILNK